MNFPDIHKLTNDKLLKAGKLLIAQPLMADANFSRTVVFLCEHGIEGALGFVLNHPTSVSLGDLLPDVYSSELNVNHGGPVQLDTLHILHRIPETIGGLEIKKGVYWGGSFKVLQDMMLDTEETASNIRLFVGYSGWSPGQLERELKEGSWLIGDATQDVVFDTHPDEVWKKAILSLGAEYRFLANMPTDPNLN